MVDFKPLKQYLSWYRGHRKSSSLQFRGLSITSLCLYNFGLHKQRMSCLHIIEWPVHSLRVYEKLATPGANISSMSMYKSYQGGPWKELDQNNCRYSRGSDSHEITYELCPGSTWAWVNDVGVVWARNNEQGQVPEMGRPSFHVRAYPALSSDISDFTIYRSWRRAWCDHVGPYDLSLVSLIHNDWLHYDIVWLFWINFADSSRVDCRFVKELGYTYSQSYNCCLDDLCFEHRKCMIYFNIPKSAPVP